MYFHGNRYNIILYSTYTETSNFQIRFYGGGGGGVFRPLWKLYLCGYFSNTKHNDAPFVISILLETIIMYIR